MTSSCGSKKEKHAATDRREVHKIYDIRFPVLSNPEYTYAQRDTSFYRSFRKCVPPRYESSLLHRVKRCATSSSVKLFFRLSSPLNHSKAAFFHFNCHKPASIWSRQRSHGLHAYTGIPKWYSATNDAASVKKSDLLWASALSSLVASRWNFYGIVVDKYCVQRYHE